MMARNPWRTAPQMPPTSADKNAIVNHMPGMILSLLMGWLLLFVRDLPGWGVGFLSLRRFRLTESIAEAAVHQKMYGIFHTQSMIHVRPFGRSEAKPAMRCWPKFFGVVRLLQSTFRADIVHAPSRCFCFSFIHASELPRDSLVSLELPNKSLRHLPRARQLMRLIGR